MMGNIPTNKRNVESQMMKRFCRDNQLLNIDHPDEYHNEFSENFFRLNVSSSQRGTLSGINSEDYIPFMKMSSRNFEYSNVKWYDCSFVRSTRKWQQYTFSNYDHSCLTDCYKVLYDNLEKYYVSENAWKTSELHVADIVYGSKCSRSSRSSYILAHWCGSNGKVLSYDNMTFTPRPGQILWFYKHILFVDNQPYEHYFAFVEWYMPMPEAIKNKYGKPIQVWRNKIFEPTGSASFIPVQRIKSKFVYIEQSIESHDVIVVLPRFRALDF